MNIKVQPWPTYSDNGRGPYWLVRVESQKFNGSLSWSAVAGEFVQCSELWRLRQREPATYRLAVRHMADFSAADPGHFEPTTGTQNGEIGTQQAGTLSRAHAPYSIGGCPAVPGQIAGTTAGTTAQAGQGQPGLGARASQSLRDAERDKFKDDPRFAAWAAGL